MLARHDWLKIVAVCVAGAEWQFKGWKWGRVATPDPVTKEMVEPTDLPPVKIFDKSAHCEAGRRAAVGTTLNTHSPNSPPPLSAPLPALGFHLYYEGDAPHQNASQWKVQLLAVSQTKRFLDAGLVARFWEAIDSDIEINKRYLLPRTGGASASASGTE